MKWSTPLVGAAAMLSEVSALGINCRGSQYCFDLTPLGGGVWPGNTAGILRDLINTVPDNKWFNNGQQIACVTKPWRGSGICAYFQNTGGWDGRKAKEMAKYIPNHGCEICGSVPTDYPRTNDVNNGQLTFNFVSNPCTSFEDSSRVC